MNISNELILIINIILFIMLIILAIVILKMHKRIKKFLPQHEKINIEEMLVEYNINALNSIKSQEDILKKIDDLKETLKFAIQKVGFVRYNPFTEVGGDLCYAIAFLDANNNGIIINSIYARENCYSYAKDIIDGKSPNHKLSMEEEKALKMAMQK